MVYNFYFSPHPQAFAQQDNKICHKQVIVGVVTLFFSKIIAHEIDKQITDVTILQIFVSYLQFQTKRSFLKGKKTPIKCKNRPFHQRNERFSIAMR
jgi:hypothetical protein